MARPQLPHLDRIPWDRPWERQNQALLFEQQHSTPEKLKKYLVGERIADSRAVLSHSAETIRNTAAEERPPGVDTQVIQRVKAEGVAFAEAQQVQATRQSVAQTERVARNEMLKTIPQRRQQIQLTADRTWPANDPASAGSRREFHLPARRRYTGRARSNH